MDTIRKNGWQKDFLADDLEADDGRFSEPDLRVLQICADAVAELRSDLYGATDEKYQVIYEPIQWTREEREAIEREARRVWKYWVRNVHLEYDGEDYVLHVGDEEHVLDAIHSDAGLRKRERTPAK